MGLFCVYHEEGRATLSGTTRQYEYYLKDHLGNTRVIFTDSDNNGEPEIIQEADYYPFGMRHQNTTATNHYLYNGKELNTDLGLDWYDYGARWLDVETGRWNSVDPLAESYQSWSGYNYVMNNPINLIDPDGKYPITPNAHIPKVYITDYTMDGLNMNLIGSYIQEIYAKNGFNIDIKIITPEQAFNLDLQPGAYGVGVVANLDEDEEIYYKDLGRSYPITGTTSFSLAHQDYDTGQYRATQYVNYYSAIRLYPKSDKNYVISYIMAHEILHQMLIQAAAHHGLDLNDISTPYGGDEPNFGNLYGHFNDVPNLNKRTTIR